MLLDENLATLISGCTNNFKIAPDKAAVSRISSSLSTLSEARALHVDAHQAVLKKLSRHLATLNSQHNLTVSAHNPTEHAANILALDTEKFRIAKVASDLEIEAERLEQELEGLKAQLAELDAQGVEGGERGEWGREAEDEIVLKLKVYRSLGIDAECDPTTGHYNKAIIRNAQKGDVHVVNVDPKFSRFFYANYFWQSM